MPTVELPLWLPVVALLLVATAGAVSWRNRRRTRRRAAVQADRIAELLRERELVLQSISDNVTYLDRDLRVVWTNWTDSGTGRDTPRPELPVCRGDVCHAVIAGAVHPCPGCPAPQVLQSGDPAEGVVVCRDGRQLRLSAAPVRDEGGVVVGVVQTARDITEKRRLARRLQRLQRLEAVGQLAAGVAHDFNNCLQVIVGHTELLAGDLPPDGPAAASARAVLRAGGQAREVVSRLLTFSRNTAPQLQPCDVGDLVQRQEDLLQGLVQPPQHLRVSVATDLPDVLADPGQVEQVVTNLVVNARDATPDGGLITVTVAAREFDAAAARAIGAPVVGRFVEIRVSDPGEGIAPELRERVFEPFFTTKAVDRGTGLGLATVHGVVTAHHGYIDLASTVGQGTTLRVGLPAVGTLPASAGAPEFRGRPARVLLVEDDPAARDLALAVLREVGHTVDVVPDGVTASARLQAGDVAYDLLVIDASPPRRGWAVYHRALLQHPGLQAVFCIPSARPAAAGARTGAPAPGEVLEKPYRPEALRAAVRAALARRPASAAASDEATG